MAAVRFPQPERILSHQWCWTALGISKSAYYRSVLSDPSFPTPVAVTRRRRGIWEREFTAWLKTRRVETGAAPELVAANAALKRKRQAAKQAKHAKQAAR